jgi:hypothetical protein
MMHIHNQWQFLLDQYPGESHLLKAVVSSVIGSQKKRCASAAMHKLRRGHGRAD